jgi:hypothetical protein
VAPTCRTQSIGVPGPASLIVLREDGVQIIPDLLADARLGYELQRTEDLDAEVELSAALAAFSLGLLQGVWNLHFSSLTYLECTIHQIRHRCAGPALDIDGARARRRDRDRSM